MSKQKIFTIAGVVLLVILVIVAFSFKGKYDDASALLVAAQADAADQKKAADAEIESLGKQNEEAQAQLAANVKPEPEGPEDPKKEDSDDTDEQGQAEE